MEGLAACFEDLEDPRTGNAGLHDFRDFGDRAVRGSVRRARLRTWVVRARRRSHSCADSSSSRRACPATTRSAGCSACSIRSSSAAAFQRFMGRFSQCQGVVAIDGKVLRRSFDSASGKSPLHMVAAWGCEQRLVLAQIATDAKSNEITAVPKLLEMLRLKGTIVTADALNCQRAIAQQIVDQGGDYALALKGNQGTLHDDVVLFLDDPASKAITAEPVVEADHGRIETRTATVSTDIAWLKKDHQWPGLAAVGKVDAPPRNRRQDNVPRPPIICSARLSRPNASTKSSARIGASRIACTGGSMSS